MKRRSAIASLAVLALSGITLLSAAPAALAQTSYSFRDLGTLGGTYSLATDVNNVAQVVGYSFRSGGTVFQRDEHAFYWASGVMTDMGTLGGTWAEAYAINNLGEAVGRAQIPSAGNTYRAFYWNNQTRTMVNLNTLLSPADAARWSLSTANDVNDNRQVVGTGIVIIDGVSYNHGFLLDLNTGVITDLGAMPGDNYSSAASLNSLVPPQVVGWSAVVGASGTKPTGYLYTPGFPLLSLIPLAHTNGITDAGEAVGLTQDGMPAYRSPDGTVTNLGTFINGVYPGAGGEAFGISNVSPANVVGQTAALLANTPHYRAFRWTVGTSAKNNLNDLTSNRGKFVLVGARAVSDNGYIVGRANSDKKEQPNYDRAFLLTPQ